MRVLQIHKYYTKKRGGGSVTAFFELLKILPQKGHEVIVFSMQDKKNEESQYAKYFIRHFDLNAKMNLWTKIKLIPKIIYNLEARKKIEELIQKEKPDVAHLHNIYHYLSPSIIDSLKKYNVPIAMSLHAYKEICPNYKLFTKGALCEKCKGGKYYNCLLNKCLKNSFSKSFLTMAEAYFHRLRKTYEKVDVFLSPSQFLKDKYVEFGIAKEKIEVLRNNIDFSSFNNFQERSFEEKDYFLYYGRLAPEKGIASLIEAVKRLKDEEKLKGNKLYIVGQGPEEKNLKQIVEELELKNEVVFCGFKTELELKEIVFKSKFSVLPSIWYENSPFTIIESQLLRKPVIISDLGGSKELILENESGFVFQAGNVSDLNKKIEKLLSLNRENREQMGQTGSQNIHKMFDQENLYAKLVQIYTDLHCKSRPK